MHQQETPDPSGLAGKAMQLPARPGVYLMKDRQGGVLYIGKAKSLRTRVRSYFQRQEAMMPKTRLMASQTCDFEIIITPTEKDALILENTLIKKHRPRYNVVFRDDKEYPYLRLGGREPYPCLAVVRKPRRDGALYYGPFASGQAVRDTLRLIRKLFPLRTCRGALRPRSRPCLYHELGRCLAPCSRDVPLDAYGQVVNGVQLFLQGRGGEVVRDLKRRMEEASRRMQYEHAARLRDQIGAITETLARQSVVCLDFRDRDVFACCCRDDDITVTALFVRSGRMTGTRSYALRDIRLSEREVLTACMSQYYQQGEFIPGEVIASVPIEQAGALEELLTEKKESRVRIIVPRRGFRKHLVDMAADNARSAFEQARSAEKSAAAVLEELRRRLGLGSAPRTIVCFDVSHGMGASAVGSMVAFRDTRPLKEAYRRFRIRTVRQPDDYAMMQEVISRYLTRLSDSRPDLILVDGGKGHLAVLCAALQDCGLGGIGAAALAKGPERGRAKRTQQEKVFLPGRKNPVAFPRNSPAFFLLQRIRDEAHRFAVSYHWLLKKNRDLASALEALPGIGPKTAKAVLRHFGGIDSLRQATRAEVAAVPGLAAGKADTIHAYLSGAAED